MYMELCQWPASTHHCFLLLFRYSEDFKGMDKNYSQANSDQAQGFLTKKQKSLTFPNKGSLKGSSTWRWCSTEALPREIVGSSSLDILAAQGPEQPHPAWKVALLWAVDWTRCLPTELFIGAMFPSDLGIFTCSKTSGRQHKVMHRKLCLSVNSSSRFRENTSGARRFLSWE